MPETKMLTTLKAQRRLLAANDSKDLDDKITDQLEKANQKGFLFKSQIQFSLDEGIDIYNEAIMSANDYAFEWLAGNLSVPFAFLYEVKYASAFNSKMYTYDRVFHTPFLKSIMNHADAGNSGVLLHSEEKPVLLRRRRIMGLTLDFTDPQASPHPQLCLVNVLSVIDQGH